MIFAVTVLCGSLVVAFAAP
nr:hypothetical protein [Vibrio anguillarum]